VSPTSSIRSFDSHITSSTNVTREPSTRALLTDNSSTKSVRGSSTSNSASENISPASGKTVLISDDPDLA
jgi:hypothetical protein